MTEAIELDIVLERRKAGEYGFRLSRTQSDSERASSRSPTGPVHLNPDELDDLVGDPVRYGRALSQALFADEGANEFFHQALAVAQSQGSGLRVRLRVDAAAPELQALHWETLSRPEDGSSIAVDPTMHLSRYISNDAVRLRSTGALRALVAVVGPRSLTPQPGGWLPPPPDIAAELTLARACLGEIPVTELDASDLQTFASRLREGPDILYLACQAVLVEGEPWLWVDDDQGKPVLAPARELVARIRELAKPPQFAVLVPFQNLGLSEDRCSSDLGALAALAPALVEAGIPAVVAMQANVTGQTAQTFLSALFQQLRVDGQADRAAAEARAGVRDRADWWVPLLITGHPSGRIWYVPGFAGEGSALPKWPALLKSIQAGRCTLILGPYLFETVFGERRAIARRWADTFGSRWLRPTGIAWLKLLSTLEWTRMSSSSEMN